MKNYESFKKRMNLVIIEYKSQQKLWSIGYHAG